MPTELTPINPVQIQGDSLGLDFGSSNWLWTGTTEIQFRAGAQRIFSSEAFALDLDAAAVMIFRIAGTTRASLTSVRFDVIDRCRADNFESIVATGAAPIIVASTTEVSNLNVGHFRLLEKATADSTVANTTTETDFATTHTVDANTMAVGMVYRIRVSGVLSTV